MLVETQLADVFDADLYVPPISSLESLDFILQEVGLFPSDKERRRVLAQLENAGFGQDGQRLAKLNLGIKKFLSIIETARQEPDAAGEKLIHALLSLRI